MIKKTGGILLMTLFIINAFAQEKMSVAILDMQGNGISQIEAKTLTEEFRSNLVSSNNLNVIERRSPCWRKYR